MNKNFLLNIFIIALILKLTALNSYAAEIKIVDFYGLIRASKITDGSANLWLKVDKKEGVPVSGELPLLSHKSGIAQDIVATPLSQNEFIFYGVSEGTWRLRLREKSIAINSIQLFQGDLEKVQSENKK